MKFRTTLWLFLCVCLLGAFIWHVESRFDSVSERAARREMLLDVDAGKVNTLELRREDLSLSCAKRDNAWYIERPVAARADASGIERILASLESMRKIQTITPDQMHSRELSLEDYGLVSPTATLVVAGPSSHQELLIGSESPLGGELYVQLLPSGNVWVTQADILKNLPGSIEDIRDRSLLSGEPFRSSKLEIQRSGGGFIQLAKINGRWMIQQPFQACADEAKIAEMLERLYAARVQRFIWDKPLSPARSESEDSGADGTVAQRAEAYGLVPDDAAARIAVWTAGREGGVELLIGDSAKGVGEESGETYARLRGSDSIFTVDSNLLKTFSVGPLDLRGKHLFPVKPEDVNVILLGQGDRKLVLRRTGDSGWTIVEPVQWKADDEIVAGLVGRITALRANRFFDGSSTNIPETGLSSTGRFVSIGWEHEDNLQAVTDEAVSASSKTGARAEPGPGLSIGNVTDDAGNLYATFENEDIVVSMAAGAVEGLGVRLADPLAYRDLTMMTVAADDIKRITLNRQGGEQTVARMDDGNWACEDSVSNKVDAAAIGELLTCIGRLRAVRIDSRSPRSLSAYGLDPPSVTLTLGLSGEEGIQKKLLMGFRAGTDGIYAMVQGQDIVFVISSRIYAVLTKPLTHGVKPSGQKSLEPSHTSVPEEPWANL